MVFSYIQLGINSIFEEDANFNLITENPLHVDDFVQKLYFEVDERGSEAAVTTSKFHEN